MEPWEALDLDDSDLPSLLHLRPCKRHHHRQDNHNPSQSQQQQQQQQQNHHPILEPNFCLSPSQNLTSTTPSQIPPPSPHSLLHHSQPQFDPPPPPQPSATSASPRIIPGPAGAVQAAMLRKALANQNPAAATADYGGDSVIPTQEYIRRAVEEGEDDGDFERNPWLCALEFLGQLEMVDGGIPSTPLSSIKEILNIGRVDKVVAIIKSCTPNGLGDLMTTLKDPTGTIDASIHHNVLAEVEFGKDISVGSVLILQKVAVFAPSRLAHYLNITLRNVVKVISKDTAPPLEQNYPVSAIKPVVPGNEGSEKPANIDKAISLELDRIDGVMDDIRQYSQVRNAAQIKRQMEQGNPGPWTRHSGDQNDTIGAKEIIKKAARIDGIDDGQRGLEYANKSQTGVCPPSSLQHSSSVANLVETANEQEIQRIHGTQKQRQTLISKASLPEWTDEQLNELFAADCEDGGSLY